MAERALVGPVIARKVLIDHANSRRPPRVRILDKSTRQQREAHGSKVVAANAIRVVPARRFARPENVSIHSSGAFAAVAAERHVVDHASRQNSRLMTDVIHQPLDKRQAGGAVWIIFPGKRDLAGENMICPEAWENLRHSFETEPEHA